MSSKNIKNIAYNFQKDGKMFFLEAATIEQVLDFEKKNDVKISNGYRKWLLFSDGGELFLPAGIQLYGVSHKPLIEVNNSDRPNDKYIVIGALSSGDPILMERNGEKISIYNHEAGVIEQDEIYDDFVSFLNDLKDILGIED